MLSENDIKEIQAMYKKERGIDLSAEEASRQGESLLRLYRAVFSKPIQQQNESEVKSGHEGIINQLRQSKL